MNSNIDREELKAGDLIRFPKNPYAGILWESYAIIFSIRQGSPHLPETVRYYRSDGRFGSATAAWLHEYCEVFERA